MMNPTGPHGLNNNQVFASLDFRSNTLNYTQLETQTVVIGSTTYTLGTTWLPKVGNKSEAVEGYELANSLVEAINGTYETSVSFATQSSTFGRANELVEAYHSGGIVHLCARTANIPSVSSTVTGVSPSISSTASNSTPTKNEFDSYSGTGTETITLTTKACKYFELENISSTGDITITRSAKTFIVKSLMGTVLFGDPASYTVTGTNLAYQIKYFI